MSLEPLHLGGSRSLHRPGMPWPWSSGPVLLVVLTQLLSCDGREPGSRPADGSRTSPLPSSSGQRTTIARDAAPSSIDGSVGSLALHPCDADDARQRPLWVTGFDGRVGFRWNDPLPLPDRYTYNPGPDYVLTAGVVLIVLGEVDDVIKLRAFFATGENRPTEVPAGPALIGWAAPSAFAMGKWRSTHEPRTADYRSL